MCCSSACRDLGVWRVALAAGLAGLLSACGGAADEAAAAAERAQLAAMRQAEEAAAKPLALTALPQLHQCLGELSRKLKAAAPEGDINLACLAGSYQGQTARGEDCLLRINAGQRSFNYRAGQREVQILWATVTQTADGKPVHNLESSDLDAQRPGVQLSQFTAVPEAVTETIALRAGQSVGGAAALPQIVYQRVQQGQLEELGCQFGA